MQRTDMRTLGKELGAGWEIRIDIYVNTLLGVKQWEPTT